MQLHSYSLYISGKSQMFMLQVIGNTSGTPKIFPTLWLGVLFICITSSQLLCSWDLYFVIAMRFIHTLHCSSLDHLFRITSMCYSVYSKTNTLKQLLAMHIHHVGVFQVHATTNFIHIYQKNSFSFSLVHIFVYKFNSLCISYHPFYHLVTMQT